MNIFTAPAEVTKHPKSQSVPTGAECIFKIEAIGSSLIFQWQKNGRDVYNDGHYSGTDTNTLTIQHARKRDEGRYRCTVRNQMNKKISEEAQLTVCEYLFL